MFIFIKLFKNRVLIQMHCLTSGVGNNFMEQGLQEWMNEGPKQQFMAQDCSKSAVDTQWTLK